MSRSKRLAVVSAAILGAAGLSTVAAAAPGDRSDVRIRAPYTHVQTGRRVHVAAPYTRVNVNSDRRRVRVRAPFVDVNVGW